MKINELQEQIIEDFSNFEDWIDKYNYIIDLGKGLSTLDLKLKKDEYKISGCQSNVWVVPEYRNGLVFFSADSDAIITKGIIALLIKILSGQTPENVANCDLYFIDRIGLKQNLSLTRSNGLSSMIKQLKLYAYAYTTKLIN